MPSQPAQDRRKHPRRDARLVVSYRPELPTTVSDITHTRSISQSGMLLTPVWPFPPGARLAIRTRPPFRGSPGLVQGTTEAVESREIVPSLLHEARVRFVDLDRQSLQIIEDFCAG